MTGQLELIKTRRGLIRAAFFLGTAVSLIGCYAYYRTLDMDRLYWRAVGYELFSSGVDSDPEKVTAAVRRIASYRGTHSTTLLLSIATAPPGSIVPPVARSEAIGALGQRNDPEVATALAALLQPWEDLDTRQDAAKAFQKLTCQEQCLLSVLHYLERIWRGEPNVEDRLIFRIPGQQEEEQQRQRLVYEALYSVLRKTAVPTVRDLVIVYGVGSEDPSPFALDLVARAQLREACPVLLRSDQSLKHLQHLYAPAPPELVSAIRELKCE
jgi:hypothetical protein